MQPPSLHDLFLLSRRFLDSYQQSYKRNILPDFSASRLSLLLGQRGVGKTTFLIQKLLETVEYNSLSEQILYVPSDHFIISKLSLYEIAESFYQQGGKLIAFDEIHQYPEWSREIKSIYDTFPSLSIMASGSSAVSIRQGTYDLSRRAVIHHMPGYSFREFLEMEHQLDLPAFSLDNMVRNHAQISQYLLKESGMKDLMVLQSFKRYLQVGYYPYHRQFDNDRLFYITLEQNLHFTIEADLPTIYPALTGHSIRKIKQLMAFIANTVPFTTNFSQLKKILEIGDERTLKAYVQYLHDCALIKLCMKASQKLRQIESPEKIYLNNPNQMFAISPGQVNPGTIRELFFLSMLSWQHQLHIPLQGDFLVDQQWTVEIGGKNKDCHQINQIDNAFLACDDIEQGIANKIPLWLFGFVY